MTNPIAAAIARYRLHDHGVPVDLSPLQECCPVTWTDLTATGLVGFCMASRPATPDHPAQIVLCESIDPDVRTIVYAHEAAHGLFGHRGSLAAARVDRWFHDRQERDAWAAAAQLLIPPTVTLELIELTPESLAEICGVPHAFAAAALTHWRRS